MSLFMLKSPARLYFPVTLCFFISGASALFFQVLWIRLFSLIFGTTQFAMGTVIAGFLGGLGFGSWLVSRKQIHIQRPLLLYGILELFIGIYGLLFPWICQFLITLQQLFFGSVEPHFISLNLFRLFFALLFLLPPTTAMGATLPILAQFCQHHFSRPIVGISFLYTVNTLGASLGAFLSGLFFIPRLGIEQTNWIAVSSNFLILCLTVLLARLVPSSESVVSSVQETTSLSEKKSFPPYLRTTLFFSSIITLILELLWSRVLEMILGSTVYVIASILTTFILGLGIGSFFSSLLLVPRQKPFFWIGNAFIVASLLLFTSLYFLDEIPVQMIFLFYTPLDKIAIFLLPLTQFSLPTIFLGFSFFSVLLILAFILYINFREVPPFYFFLGAFFTFILMGWGIRFGIQNIYEDRHSRIGQHFEIFFLVKFFMVCGTILPPAIFFGMIFPLGLSTIPQTQSLRQQVGYLSFVSTMGCIIGSLAGGFLLIPWIGVKNLFIVLILFGLFLGFFHLVREHLRFAIGTGIVIFVFFSTLLYNYSFPFHEHKIASGVIQYLHLFGSFDASSIRSDFKNTEPAFISHRDGVTATVSIKESEDNFALKVNGKVDASTQSDMYTQVLLGQIPMLIAPNQKKVLVIGYGSGVTVSSVLTHSELESVTLVEIEKEVLNASRYFRAIQLEDPLTHPKVRLEVNDARNYLALSSKIFDVIISEPSNPWMSGASKLFTVEFYKTVQKRLAPDGIMANWIQLYGMDHHSLFILFKTFQSVFPYIYFFRINHDLLLIGRNQPLTIQAKTLESRFSSRVQEDINRLKIWTLADIFGFFSLMPDGFKQLLPEEYEVLHSEDPNLRSGDILFIFQNQSIPEISKWKTIQGNRTIQLQYSRNAQVFQTLVPEKILTRIECRRIETELNTDNLPIIEYQAPKNIFFKDENKTLDRWLDSVSGESLFPQFIEWDSLEMEQTFQEQLFYGYLLKPDSHRMKEMIQWNMGVPERESFARKLEWKADLFHNQTGSKRYYEIPDTLISESLTNSLFSYALLVEKSSMPLIFLRNLMSEGIWLKHPELQRGWKFFFQSKYEDCLQSFATWDSKKLETPFEYFLIQGLCLEKIGQYHSAETTYELFFQKLMNQIAKEHQFILYLFYLNKNTQIQKIRDKTNALKEDIEGFFKLINQIKGPTTALYTKLLKDILPFLERNPQSYLFIYYYFQIANQISPSLAMEFLEKRISTTQIFSIFKTLAFLYKMQGFRKNSDEDLKKALHYYQESIAITPNPWDIKDTHLRIELIQEKLFKDQKK